ncbi:MAG: guanylate kinase [Candidatus Eiseniibacteriota bacterium]|jgi:guanylate kinase
MSVTPQRLSRPMHLVVSGPSGAGKTTIVKRLLERDRSVRLSVSVTTRRPRSRERSGREYEFVDRATFERRREAGAFVEWAEVHGQLYGTPRSGLEALRAAGYDALLDVDYQGGLAIQRELSDTVSVFLLPPSMEVLEERLRHRASDDPAEIARRLEVAAREMAHAVHYDYVVINEAIEQAYEQVHAILVSERWRVARIEPETLAALARLDVRGGGAGADGGRRRSPSAG